MSRWFILDGHTPVEVDTVTGANYLEKAGEGRIVAQERIGPSLISTCFLCLDHSFTPDQVLLFETLVFDGPMDGEMERYSTWEEAEAGHARMVQRVAEALGIEG